LERPWIFKKKSSIAVLIAFLMLTSALAVLGVTVPKVKDLGFYKSHGIIDIANNNAFIASEGVVRGAGSASDPFIIDGWHVTSNASPALIINDTDAFVVIRNSTFEGSFTLAQNDGIVIERARNIQMENLTIQGFRTGIVVEGLRDAPSNNITVRECAVTECTNGIVTQNSTNLLVEHSYFTQLGLSGLVVENSSKVDIRDNKVDYYGVNYPVYYPAYYSPLTMKVYFAVTGIGIADSNDSIVHDNDVWGMEGAYGNIAAARCHNVSFDGNSMTSSNGAARMSHCSDLTISNNTLMYGSWISIDDSVTCLVADNVVTNAYGSGIQISSTSDAVVVRNTMFKCGGGIYAAYLNDSVVERNFLTNCTSTGLVVIGTDVTVARNLIFSDPGGVGLTGHNITFEWNQVGSNRGTLWGIPHGGLRCYGSNGMRIENNSFSSDYPGIEISTCSNVSLVHNNISDDITLSDDDNLTISGNAMHNVSVPEYFTFGGVSWDWGYPKGGNYWSQYAGIDLKSGPNQNMPGPDGIGDTPYQVNATQLDDYPLMTASIVSDDEPPLTQQSLAGYRGEMGWYVSSVNLTLSGSDVYSGIATTSYRIDGSAWTAYGTQVTITSEGTHTLEYYSADQAGNSEKTRTVTVKIDTKSPHSAIADGSTLRSDNTGNFTLRYEFADNTSGLAYFKINSEHGDYWWSGLGASTVPFAQVRLSDGDQRYYVYAHDEAGNENHIVIQIHDSLNEDKQPLSMTGPFGPWYLVAVLVDLVLIGYLVHPRMFSPYPSPKPIERRLGPGELDKEDIVDGYPKYLKKM